MKDVICFDVETTTSNKGAAYDETNRLVVGGYLDSTGYRAHYAGEESEDIAGLFVGKTVIGFNLKFDGAWVRRQYGVVLNQQVWDCQLAEYIYSGQTLTYPSLNQCCERYGLPQKLDVVKEEYWSKGVDTDAIPRDVLSEYLEQDVRLTMQLYEAQQGHELAPLVRQCGWDLLFLLEAEWNGCAYDFDASLAAAADLDAQVAALDKRLNEIAGAELNWNSREHISAVLFGGTVSFESREEYEFVYKNPKKLPVLKSRLVTSNQDFPRLIQPLKETSKEGVFGVDEDSMNRLPRTGKAGKIIALLQERAKINKLSGTYYRGIPKLRDKMNWRPGFVHGQLQQVAVVTGRLSSAKPNLQNITPEAKKFFISRFQ